MTAEELLGQTLGPYTIEEVLGSGGMSVVYRARTVEGQVVALKVLFPPPGVQDETLARFEREARTAKSLSHPNLVQVIDAGHVKDRAYIAMTYIKGRTLTDHLAKVGHLDEAAAADIAWQLADALYYAHSKGIVHRDIKPSNILLTDDGRALLTDFGVAQALDDPALTRTGYTVGTPAYMSPEQAAGDQQVDGRADLYSLGVVLYQMITGRLPFQGGTPQILHAHVYKPPPAPSTIANVSPGMEAIVLQALAKEPAKRFQTGAAMAQALDALADSTGLRHQAIPSLRKSGLRSPFIWAVVLLIAVGGLGLATWQFALAPTLAPTATIAVVLIPTNTPSPTRPPTLIPSPIPLTATPSPTPSLPPPTATPSPTLVPPTETPSPPPSPTETPLTLTCSQLADEAMADLANNLGERLGCPRAAATTFNAAWQPFERGRLLWREEPTLIYILNGDANTWRFVADKWEEGDLEPPPTVTPPEADLRIPVRGFGRVWREEDLLNEIGWGLDREIGFVATLQEFDNSDVWYNPLEETFTILFNDDTYQIVNEADLGGNEQ